MMVGKEKLQEIYKNDDFEEGDYTPNGIDLRLKSIYIPNMDKQVYGIMEGEKIIPDFKQMVPIEGRYILYPGSKYFINCGHMDIPAGYAQEYKLRSTFMRCGCELESSWGDSGYSGDLIFALKVFGVGAVVIEDNERVVQMGMHYLDGVEEYNGSYQNNEIYNK